jgi:hypothetical protein
MNAAPTAGLEIPAACTPEPDARAVPGAKPSAVVAPDPRAVFGFTEKIAAVSQCHVNFHPLNVFSN